MDHSECSFAGAERQKYVDNALNQAPDAAGQRHRRLTSLTNQVMGMRRDAFSSTPRQKSFATAPKTGTIDYYINADLQSNGITPAGKTTDYEFIRRVTLDLTGRIPTAAQVQNFVADSSADKRSKLIDSLIGNPAWLDKWTMYYGDLFKNTDTRPSSGIRRFPEGRNALYTWIFNSLRDAKPYNQMATELIATQADNSYQSGPINYLVGVQATGGPQQDVTDSMAAAVAENFLGMSHVNCLLCHNGRGHLDTLSLWGKNTTRYQAWQLASYFSHTRQFRTVPDAKNAPNTYYWSQVDDTKGFTTDYTLNTTSGNRPTRQPLTPNCKSGQPCYYVNPQYIFTGATPAPGENYRVSIAAAVTNDFQFARATVNYIWEQFFGRGIVDPSNMFDPARLDPDNPPPDPWTLQPSNARLLNSLAQHFIDNKYDLRWLMREITNSETYQLASEYDPAQWNPAWEQYFARKFVRRLWAEEMHDAIVISSATNPNYSINGFSNNGFPNTVYAMQSPDVVGTPNGTIAAFLDAFLRGNRDDVPRKEEGAVQQALNLMNDPFVMQRIQTNGAFPNQLITTNLSKSDTDLINSLFLGILSRPPSAAELTTAQNLLKTGNRTQQVQDLVWSLYNKVDFVFNY